MYRDLKSHLLLLLLLSLLLLLLQEGSMPLQQAVQVAYSYSHCSYSPTALLQPLVDQIQDRPELLEGQSLTT
jgi:hypothetical protein